MFERASKKTNERIARLRTHLDEESPLLVEVVGRFQELDKVAYRLGLLSPDESFTNDIPWWPLIAVLGTFSAGKSSFINHYLGTALQRTGNQAVDDKFTVLCYSSDREVRVLPGLSLNADPRFPFYRMSEQIDSVAHGEGGRINNYLQLKTCPSETLRGRILIDSPGFDADEQRKSTLSITDHIVNLSDLVLVFFDARHPEPGAMQDTLEHLVSGTVRRNDANKVLFILNQIDVTAREDNVEDVVAAWQRAIAKGGIASGRFYTIYNEEAAVAIKDEALERRYRSKRDSDLAEIHQRIDEVSVERLYRVVGALDTIARAIEQGATERIPQALEQWRKRVLALDAAMVVPVLALLLAATIAAGYWQGLSFAPPWLHALGPAWVTLTVLAVLLVSAAVATHFWLRGAIARVIARRLQASPQGGDLGQAFLKNTGGWHSLFHKTPVGWTRSSRKHLAQVREAADRFVQKLNDRYANPSGSASREAPREASESPAGVRLASASRSG